MTFKATDTFTGSLMLTMLQHNALPDDKHTLKEWIAILTAAVVEHCEKMGPHDFALTDSSTVEYL